MELSNLELNDWISKRLPNLSVKKDSDIEKILLKKYNDFDFYPMMNNGDHRRPGHFFLYEKVTKFNDSWIVSYPRIGIYIHEYIIDMATEVEWVDVRRTYENRIELKGGDYLFNNISTEIQRFIIWDDFMLVYGAWDHNPSWKELRVPFSNTMFAYESPDIVRERKLNSLLR